MQKDTHTSNDELDFSSESSSPGKDERLSLGKPYDSRPQEDSARRYIAYSLIGLLWVLVGGILILVSFGSIHLSEIKEFAVILGPIVTLVSAATGFYYGTKSTGKSS